MKKIIYFFSFILMFFALQSCDEQLEIIDAESIELKGPPVKYDTGLSEENYVYEGDIPYLCAEELTYNLIAGQNTDAGDVTIGNDENNLYITVHSTFGFQDDPKNVKIWIGTDLEDIPSAGNGQPIPGQFPIKEPVAITDDTITFRIPFVDIFDSEWNCEDLQKLYIVVHADVLTDDSFEGSPETAWGCDCVDCDFEKGERWWCAIEYTPECCDDCMDAFGFKYKSPLHSQCLEYTDNGENQTLWSNNFKYRHLEGASYKFSLIANADGCKNPPEYPQNTDGSMNDPAILVGDLYITTSNEGGQFFTTIDYDINSDYELTDVNLYIGSNSAPGDLNPLNGDYYYNTASPQWDPSTTKFIKLPWPGDYNKWDTYIIPHAKVCKKNQE